ncbi:MAG: ComEC/Rec2 family competence protein [Synechococcales cyanobacterium M58_A2018_015]|nr:ComEC/Rec2 family competence protein [Synechococcales cyanobacterium M58_A2018_015]
MTAVDWAVLCFAYLVGLLLTAIPGDLAGIPLGAIGLFAAGVTAAFIIRPLWRTGPQTWVWIAAGLVGVAAILHVQMRLPQPSATDICHLVFEANPPVQVTRELLAPPVCQPSIAAKSTAQRFRVKGRIVSSPRLTRSERIQFELAAQEASATTRRGQVVVPAQPVTGTLYVTVPRAAEANLYPGLTVEVEGTLYKPKPAVNPGGFDFARYLAQQGIFAGLNGRQVLFPAVDRADPPLLWSIRQRIIQVQGFLLSSPEAPLLSAMVLGRKGVNVPYELQDQFAEVGLAHVLAASGFQVSLLIGVLVALTRRLRSAIRFWLGLSVIGLYVGLTGAEPPAVRAGLMGVAVLLGLTLERKVKPLACLWAAATLMLLWNPLWIWNLGFQLSFLATLGLLVTVPVLTKWLDWLPSTLASTIAVPTAAYLWLLPLQLYAFGVVSPYSVPVNVLTSPLVTLISIGGMISGAVALIYPPAGSALAWLLGYPTHGLIWMVEVSSRLPSNTYALGTLAVGQILLLYGLFALVWLWRRVQPYWWLAGLVGLGLVLVPIWYNAATLTRVTVLATSDQPVLVVQEKGQTGLIYQGDEKTTEFTVLPFLRQQGINRIDWAIAPYLGEAELAGWQRVLQSRPVQRLYAISATSAALDQPLNVSSIQKNSELNRLLPLSNGQPLPMSHQITATLVNSKPLMLQLQLGKHSWFWLDRLPADHPPLSLPHQAAAVQTLIWSGQNLPLPLLQQLRPMAAIAIERETASETEAWLQQHRAEQYWLDQDGALQWSEQTGFITTRTMD